MTGRTSWNLLHLISIFEAIKEYNKPYYIYVQQFKLATLTQILDKSLWFTIFGEKTQLIHQSD